MEFDIGNILYIVITVVAVTIGLMGRKKKPGTQGTGEGVGKSQPGFMENLERLLTMGQEPVVVSDLQPFEEDLPPEEGVAATFEPESRLEAKKTPKLLDEYKRIMEGGTVLGGSDMPPEEGEIMSQPMELLDLDQLSSMDFIDLVNEFDARKAIVYSAIINRLDY